MKKMLSALIALSVSSALLSSLPVLAEAETVVRDGYTYVPLEFFREFLNETSVENGVISVSPQMCELD